MDLKDLLKEGGLSVAAICTAVYVCGWQYYLALFHAMGIDLHFFVPVPSGVGAGVEPVVTILILPGILAAMAGVLMRLFASEGKRVWLRRSLTVAGVACGALLPAFIELNSARWLRLTLTAGEEWTMALLGMGIATMVMVLIDRGGMPHSGFRYHSYALLAILLIAASARYALIRGKAAAATDTPRVTARLVLDERLQTVYGDSVFQPVLELGDDLVLVCYGHAGQADSGQTVFTKGRMVFIKKSLIRAVEYAK